VSVEGRPRNRETRDNGFYREFLVSRPAGSPGARLSVAGSMRILGGTAGQGPPPRSGRQLEAGRRLLDQRGGE